MFRKQKYIEGTFSWVVQISVPYYHFFGYGFITTIIVYIWIRLLSSATIRVQSDF